MADKTVALTITDPEGNEQSLTVPAEEVDKYTHGGWSVAESTGKSTNK